MAKHKQRYKKHPGLVLKELEHIASTCTECGASNKIDWLAEMKFPHEAIKPNDGRGRWVPVSVPMICGVCASNYSHNIPIIERECRWHIYGDEAGRTIEYRGEKIHFFCLTLVGLHNKKQDLLQSKLHQFKLEARPDLDPAAWTHHFTEIWSDSGDHRKFSFNGVNEKVKYGERFANMISDLKPELVCYNFSNAILLTDNRKENAAKIKLQKEDLFKQALLITMDSMRLNKKAVVWHFDNIKDTTLGQATEGWAMECFLGLQYTPLFTYLAAGAHIAEPEFLKPGSHYLLEIADFISFCVARDFMKIADGKLSEIPSARLGKIFCHRIMGDGQPDYSHEMASFFLKRYFES